MKKILSFIVIVFFVLSLLSTLASSVIIPSTTKEFDRNESLIICLDYRDNNIIKVG